MQTVSTAVKTLMFSQPYYGLFACGLNKRFVDPKICSTAGVGLEGINYSLVINKEFWDKLSPDSKMRTIWHELLHICFGHCDAAKDWEARFPRHNLLNIAMDMSLECYIDQKYWEDWILADSIFKKFPHLERCKSTKFYYEFLTKLENKINQDLNGQGSGGSGDSNDSNGSGDFSDEYLDGDYDNLSNEEKQRLSHNLKEAEELHLTWEQFKNLPKEVQDLIKQQRDFQMKNTAKFCGNIPGELKDYIEELFKVKKSVFNWKAYFRRLLGISFDIYQKKTRRKESRRFCENPGLKLKKKHKLLVAIDTSGSINTKELEDFFSEIYHIYKCGADIHILECDVNITNEYDYNGKPPKFVTGRGGTSFRPVIDYYNKNTNLYTTLIYFTDGYGDQDRCKPCRKTIWVISSDGDQDAQYPGYVIKIPKTN